MDVSAEAGKSVIDAIQPEDGGSYPPRLVRQAWLALTQGEPAATYAWYEVNDRAAVWTVLGVQATSLLLLQAQADLPQWTMHSGDTEGRLIRAEIQPASNVTVVALENVGTPRNPPSHLHRLMTQWTIHLSGGQSFTLPVRDERPEGWHQKVDDFVSAVRKAAFAG